MSRDVSYSEARANFASLWDEAESTREPVRMHRRGKEDMVMLPAAELAGLLEAAHLLRSPKNASRLLSALARARAGEGTPQSVDELAKSLGL